MDKEQLKRSVDELSDQMLDQEDKIFENQKFIQKLKKVLEEKEEVSLINNII